MLIERKEYLQKLIALKDKRLIKIITGVRRCGKSTLLEMYTNYLLQQGVNARNIITINFEDFDNIPLRGVNELNEYIVGRLIEGEMNYIILDEIQHVQDFPAVVDSLFIKKNVDLYITGSNAYMLSSEIATLISGRYIEIKMLPLSFKEFSSAVDDKMSRAEKYSAYLDAGALPYALELRDSPGELKDYLEGLYNTIVIKDVATRKRIKDISMLERVTKFMFDNIGNLVSPKKIADTLTSAGRKTDNKTIERYIDGLVESFILYRAMRYNIKGKQYLKTQEKYYVVDIGIRHALLGQRSTDVGHILENIIYFELLRRGYRVGVGKLDALEVDFVAIDERGLNYIQVAASTRDSSTLERELKPLRMIDDHYPKMLLTLDDDPEADYDGIRRMNALDWLMGK